MWAALMAIRATLRTALCLRVYPVPARPQRCGSSAPGLADRRLRVSACPPTCPPARNLIVNGDFSLDVLNGGFDWQYQKQQSVTLTLDPSEFHRGTRSLLIAFDGPGVSDAGFISSSRYNPAPPMNSLHTIRVESSRAPAARISPFRMWSPRAVMYDSDELKEAGEYWKRVNRRIHHRETIANCWCCVSGACRKAVRSVVSSGSTISASWPSGSNSSN